MIAIVTFVPLFIITWLFCTFAALHLSNYKRGRQLSVAVLLWAMAVLLLFLLLVAAGFVGSTENDRKLYPYFTLPLMIFPPIVSLLVAKQKTFARHVTLVLASLVLAAPVTATWLLLFI